MGYADIGVYLKGFGVDISKQTSNVNSKWVYSKELLADEPDETLFKIAEELEIDHGLGSPTTPCLADSKFWKTSHFRLFISQVSAVKDRGYR